MKAIKEFQVVSARRLAELSPTVRSIQILTQASSYKTCSTVNAWGDGGFASVLRGRAGSVIDTPPIVLYELADALIVDQGIVLTRDGFALEESLADTSPLETPTVIVRDSTVILTAGLHETISHGLLLKKRGQTNFGHWLTELLPKAFIVDESGLKLPLLVHAPGREFHFLLDMYVDSLSLVLDSPEVTPLGPYPTEVGSLFYVTGVSQHPERKHPLLNRLATQMKSKAGAPGEIDQRLFLTRHNSTHGRFIVNFDEILPFLQQRDYKIVEPSVMSIPEQVRLFSGASNLCGITGAAMTNSLFAPDGAR